jgi:hypothetical protein
VSGIHQPSPRAFWARTRSRLGALVARRPEPGREPVAIAELASPLRLDVVLIRDFLRLCTQHFERGGACDESLTGVARSTSYWTWFCEVHVPRAAPELAGDPGARGRAFVARVAASFALARELRERGVAPRVVLRSARQILPTETGKPVRARYHPDDDAHPLALRWQAGQDVLAPADYAVRRERALAPLDHTRALLAAFDDDPRGYLRFVASGFGQAEPANARELVARVRADAPERAAELEAVLRADGRVELAF